MLRALRIDRPWLCAVLLGACAGDPPEGAVQVTVAGLGADITQLRVAAMLDGVRVAGAERLCPADEPCDTDGEHPAGRFLRQGESARFALVPPRRPSTLSVTIEALRGDRCFVAAGDASLSTGASALALTLRSLPAPRCCNAAWLCRENPLPDNHGINALWASSPDVLWAVGDGGAVLRLQGGAFTRVPGPTRVNLIGLFGRGAQELWALGREGADGAGVLLHDDGRGLAVHRRFPVAADALFGWSDELWVGGRGALWRFDARGELLETVDVAGAAITALGGPAPDQAWLAGYDGGGAVVLRRVGTQIARESPPTGFTPRALHATATEAWVLGDDQGMLVLARRDGAGAWTQTLPRRAGTMDRVYRSEDQLGLWATAAADLWVASGEVFHIPDRRAPPTQWSPEDLGAEPFARALLGDAGGLWAAGSGGRMLRRSGGSWAQRHPAAGVVLDSLASISGGLRGAPWLGGRGGLHRAEVSGLTPVAAQRGHLYSKVLAVDEDAFVVRDLRDLLRVRPDGSESQLAASGAIYDLWASGDDLWAVGDGFAHVRGAGACGAPQGVSCARYRGVWGRPSGELFVVGDGRAGGGCVLRCDAAGRWSDETPALADMDLFDVWGSGSGEVFAVGRAGAAGLILRRGSDAASASWLPEAAAAGSLPPLVGVWAPPEPSAGDAWAVGSFGALWRRRQGVWGSVATDRAGGLSDFQNYAVDIFGLRADDVWFLGTHGTVLRYRP